MHSEPAISLEVIPESNLETAKKTEILSLCSNAYGIDFFPVMQSYGKPLTHILLYLGEELVSHALWVTRLMQAGDSCIMKTAYVEAVATLPIHQGKGYATAVMTRLEEEVQDYDIAALSPSDISFYERLGWRLWDGPLSFCKEGNITPTKPESRVMIYFLPRTPDLDLGQPLSVEWRPGDIW